MGGMYSTLGTNIAGGTGAPGGMRQFMPWVSGAVSFWQYWGPPMGIFGSVLVFVLLSTMGSCY